MGIPLNDEIRSLLDGRHFAVLATINPDGGPQSSAMWVGRDGDEVLFSTVKGRRKDRNLERDPRASVTVIDSEDCDSRRRMWRAIGSASMRRRRDVAHCDSGASARPRPPADVPSGQRTLSERPAGWSRGQRP
jgi:PPOX class probable F420-dependent enzyme